MHKPSYRTIVFDMDGTLLNAQNELTNQLKIELINLKARGYKLILATGRTFGEVQQLVEKGLFTAYICSNAMSIYNEEQERMKHLILPEEVLQIVIETAVEQRIYYELRQDLGPGCVYKEHLPYMKEMLNGEKSKTVSTHEWNARCEIIKDLKEMEEEDLKQAVKIYFFHPEVEKLKIWRETLANIIENYSITIESSSVNSCEIVHVEANKGLGLKQLVSLGYTTQEQILCFGDSFNDISMFKFAAYSVAMKNGNDELKKIANEITTYSNDEDGVLHWLVEHLKE